MSERVVLITGITGFVGGALAARLAGRESVLAVVRAENREEARARVAASLARFLGPSDAAAAASSLRLLVGDVTAPRLYEQRELDEVTHVVHAAACTSFASRREVWRTNVEGTERLAARMQRAPQLERFLYVSSAYCCGDQPGRVVYEDDSPRPAHGHVNEYARSKAHAELLLTTLGFGDRLLIARPSVVVGHTQLGVRPSSSLYWYYRALAALGAGPFTLEARRDIVAVDYVAEALDFLLTLERPRFAAYHVSAGRSASESVRDILRSVEPRSRGGWRSVTAAALGQMHEQLRPLVRSEDEARRLARGLAACAKFGELAVQCFDNTRLLSEGFAAPPRFSEYAEPCRRSTGNASLFEQMIDDA